MSIKAGTRVHDIALGLTGTTTQYHPPVRATQKYGEWDYVTENGHEYSASTADLVELAEQPEGQ
ncbi:hypothetical protein [Streptomyces agglomeratus]|nr:hypothetical protein [Streptomyces agglomeratus]